MPITYDQSGVTYDAAAYTYNGEGYQPTVFPIAGVYIAFTDGPYVASPAWTEVTQYVRGITTHRGRASDLDQFDTGTAQLVLDNRDRRFDPFYTSGPYYPNGLTPRRQIRIVGQIGGSTYEVFRGFIAGWPVTWSEAGYDSTVTIQCFDALGLMATEVVPTDWPDYYTRTLNPIRYYRANDSQGSTILRDSIGNESLTNSNPASLPNYFATPPLAAGFNTNSAFATSYYNFTSGAYPLAGVSGAQDFSFSGWVQFRAPTSYSNFLGSVAVGYGAKSVSFEMAYITASTGGAFAYSYTANNLYAELYGFAGTGASRIYQTTVAASPAQALHFAVTYTAATNAAAIYINGVNCTGTATTYAAGGGFSFNDRLTVNITNASIQDLSIYNRVISAAEIVNLYNFGQNAIPETTSARMQRLLDTTDWPAALEGFPASPVGTVAEIGSGTGVIPELQLVADSEGGELYVSKTGVLTMTARRDVFNATRSANVQATFTDSGVGIRYGTELQIQYDADNLKNDITVNYSGDGEVNVYNDTVITGYGAASTTIETQLDSPTSALDLATLELGVEGVLVPQISPIDVSPNTAAADWQSILGLELLDRVNFKRTPTVGNQFNRDALVNAIDHQIEPGVWRTQLTLSMRYTSPLTLDDDMLGTLDYNYLG